MGCHNLSSQSKADLSCSRIWFAVMDMCLRSMKKYSYQGNICNISPFSWMKLLKSASLFAQLPAGAHWLPLHLNHVGMHSFLSLSLYESLNPHNGFCKKDRSWQTVTHAHFLLPLYHQFVLVCLNLKLSILTLHFTIAIITQFKSYLLFLSFLCCLCLLLLILYKLIILEWFYICETI